MFNLDTIKGNNVLDTLQLIPQKFDRFKISFPSNVISKMVIIMKKIIGEYNVIPNVFTEFKNNALILSTSNNVKLHGIVINRMQVIYTL